MPRQGEFELNDKLRLPIDIVVLFISIQSYLSRVDMRQLMQSIQAKRGHTWRDSEYIICENISDDITVNSILRLCYHFHRGLIAWPLLWASTQMRLRGRYLSTAFLDAIASLLMGTLLFSRLWEYHCPNLWCLEASWKTPSYYTLFLRSEPAQTACDNLKRKISFLYWLA